MSVQALAVFNLVSDTYTGPIAVPFGKAGDRVVSVQVIRENTGFLDLTSYFDATLPADNTINQISPVSNGGSYWVQALFARGF